jgi:hypothetical protein
MFPANTLNYSLHGAFAKILIETKVRLDLRACTGQLLDLFLFSRLQPGCQSPLRLRARVSAGFRKKGIGLPLGFGNDAFGFGSRGFDYAFRFRFGCDHLLDHLAHESSFPKTTR